MDSNDFLQLEGQKIALILNERDNVAVVLAAVNKSDNCIVRGRGEDYCLQIMEDVDFGHKVALSSISKGEPIYKYGEKIGVARDNIPQGSWVHTHNLYCERGMS
jgi:hypothetical protein